MVQSALCDQVYAAAITFSIYKITSLRFLRTNKLCFMQLLFRNFFGTDIIYIIPCDGGDNDLASQLKWLFSSYAFPRPFYDRVNCQLLLPQLFENNQRRQIEQWLPYSWHKHFEWHGEPNLSIVMSFYLVLFILPRFKDWQSNSEITTYIILKINAGLLLPKDYFNVDFMLNCLCDCWYCLCYCLYAPKAIIILRRIDYLSTSGQQEDFIWWWNKILINAEDRIRYQQSMERLSFEETTFFHLPSTCDADIWWRASTHHKKKSFGGKSPISTYLGRYRGRKSKVWKLMNNFLISLEESFEFKKIKPNEHGHIHKASESSKNPF